LRIVCSEEYLDKIKKWQEVGGKLTDLHKLYSSQYITKMITSRWITEGGNVELLGNK
jgi:hypothetical protein